jgi:hypothetical protein
LNAPVTRFGYDYRARVSILICQYDIAAPKRTICSSGNAHPVKAQPGRCSKYCSRHIDTGWYLSAFNHQLSAVFQGIVGHTTSGAIVDPEAVSVVAG